MPPGEILLLSRAGFALNRAMCWWYAVALVGWCSLGFRSCSKDDKWEEKWISATAAEVRQNKDV